MFTTLKENHAVASLPLTPEPTTASAASGGTRLEVVNAPDSEPQQPPVQRARGGLPPRVLKRISEHIEGNLERRINIESLAGVAGLSLFHFARAFKQSAGVTPHEFVTRRRIERAIDLLVSTELPLSEIAIAAGFADQSHCARRFREYVGMSPREYRWWKR